MNYIKRTCCKNVLHKRHGRFHFLILFLKLGKDLECFIFFGIKDQIFGDKKDIVSVPYLNVFEFLAYNSIRIFKSYGIVSLNLKLHLILLGIGHAGNYNFLNFGNFLINYKGTLRIKDPPGHRT